MGIFTSVTVESKSSVGELSSPRTTLYGIPYIKLVRSNGAKSTLIVNGKNNNEEVIVSESYSTVSSSINTGFSDFAISLTVNGTDENRNDNYPYSISLLASKIVEVYANPQNASESIVAYRDEDNPNDRLYTVNETVAEIQGLTPNSPVTRSITVVLDKTDVNNLHTTPVSITPAQLGLSAGFGFNVDKEATLIVVDPNGTPFVAGFANTIDIKNSLGSNLCQISQGIIDETTKTTYNGGTAQKDEQIIDNTGITIDAGSAITGGVAESTITITLFYRVIAL